MATGRPMFPGGTVDEQLHLIFKVSSCLLLLYEQYFILVAYTLWIFLLDVRLSKRTSLARNIK